MRRRYVEDVAHTAAMCGIPLAEPAGYTCGGTRWMRVCGRWFYEGLSPAHCEGRNVTLVATPEEGMSAEEFGRLWRGVVRDLTRVARCVRVRLVEPAKEE